MGWAAVAHFVMAGFMGALWLQHFASWRVDRSHGEPFWLMLWSVTLAILFLVNGLITAIPSGPDTGLLFVRGQILAATALLALPAVKSFTRGRPVRWYVALASALFLGRAVLWLTTDLVFVHTTLNGNPQNGRLLGATFLAPLAVVAWYIATSTTQLAVTRTRFGLQLAASLGFVGLLLAYLLPPGQGAELLKGVWALPLGGALHFMGEHRIRAADQRAARQHRLRGALTVIGNAAWNTTDRIAILKLAETVVREQVGDDTLVGSLRPGANGQVTATFESAKQPPADSLIRDFLADVCRVLSVAAERISLTENLRDEALTDALTRLPNRKALELHLEKALLRAGQEGTHLGLLYCDIDQLKRQNDNYGHAWGDELLQRIAGFLHESRSDRVLVARYGGDEFVVVIEDASSRHELVDLATAIRTGLDLPGNDRLAPLLSVGVADWAPGDDVDPDLLLRQADAAMFEGKRSGAGVVVFDEVLRARMLAEQNLGREIGDALTCNEFELHYQPIVDARTLGIVGVEALIRWPHADGMRMPAQWIPFAEKTGLIVPVGRWVVVAARDCAMRFGLPVAVNVAARQLAEPRFVEQLREDWGNDNWHLLTLEITESDLLEDVSHVIDSLTAVRALGARISIDDFGTGHSSFDRLANLPVDVLKIDQAFVRDLDNPGGVAIVRAIVSLARAYGLDIVAEGVERIEQLETLAALGVPKLQGYLIGRPSPRLPQRVDRADLISSRTPGTTGKQPRAPREFAREGLGAIPEHSPVMPQLETPSQAGAKRDQAGEERDRASEQRDRAGEDRDQAGEQRDHAAERRDQAAEFDAELFSTESVAVALRRAARARLEAASDRRWSALDRRASASERSLADLDRDNAMTDREASAKQRGAASLDALTGALRRGAGLVELEREIARSRRTGESLALAFVDVDRLKGINDTLGHAAGDRMLLEVASTLRAKLRSYDLIFRYGGDEFVCVLAGLNAADASIRMSVVQAALAVGLEHGSVTVGVSELQDDDSLESLMERADEALYLMRHEERTHR